MQESPDEAVIPQKQVGCFLYPVIFLSFYVTSNFVGTESKKKGVIITDIVQYQYDFFVVFVCTAVNK